MDTLIQPIREGLENWDVALDWETAPRPVALIRADVQQALVQRRQAQYTDMAYGLPALIDESVQAVHTTTGEEQRQAARRARVHHSAGRNDRPDQPHPRFQHAPPQGRSPPHPLPRPPPLNRDLLLEQGVDLIVIKELLGHAHIGVTAGVYAHVRLRLQRQAIDTLGAAFGPTDDDPEDPPATAAVR